jgi:hypothetical protein
MSQNLPFDLFPCNRASSPAVLAWFDFMFRQEPKCNVASQVAPQEPVAAEEYPEDQCVGVREAGSERFR